MNDDSAVSRETLQMPAVRSGGEGLVLLTAVIVYVALALWFLGHHGRVAPGTPAIGPDSGAREG